MGWILWLFLCGLLSSISDLCGGGIRGLIIAFVIIIIIGFGLLLITYLVRFAIDKIQDYQSLRWRRKREKQKLTSAQRLKQWQNFHYNSQKNISS